jgi:ligand-binding sensor domain-containing protein/AraC-like DNA-binding protein/nitrogen-specific signal transduction histidine kinase
MAKSNYTNCTLKLFLLFIVLQFIITGIYSQNINSAVFKHFSGNDGLNNSFVFDVMQDKEGFIWFATKDGINKFDGSNFESYYPSGQTNNAQDNIVNCFALNPDSVLFCGTVSGNILYFDKWKNVFVKFHYKGLTPIREPIHRIRFYNREMVVCTSSGAYLIKLDSQQAKPLQSGKSTEVHDFLVDHKGHTWFATSKGVIHSSSSFKNLSLTPQNNAEETIGDQIMSLNEDHQHRIWAGTRNRGVFIYDTLSGRFQNIIKLNPSISHNLGTPKMIINSPDGNVTIASNTGVFIFNKNLELLNAYKQIENNPYSLSNNSVYSVFYDKLDVLWIATFGGGVNMYDPSAEMFVRLSHMPYNEQGVMNNMARSFYQTSDNKLWFGTKRGVSVFDSTNYKWQHIRLEKEGKEDPIVLAINQSENDDVWIGTYNRGLVKINPHDYSYEEIKFKNTKGEPVGIKNIYAIGVDDNNLIWSGGIKGNVTVYNPKTDIAFELPITNVRSIFMSDWDKVYIGTLRGLLIVDKNDFSIDQPSPVNILLNDTRVFNVFYDSNVDTESFWLGTEGNGIIRWNFVKREVIAYSVGEGLPSNFVYGIVSDKEGNLWLSTTNGISKFSINSEKFTNFSQNDGLTDHEFNFGAYGKTNSGVITFGGRNGFTMFNPANLKEEVNFPNLAFHSFKLFGKEVELGDDPSAILTSHINSTERIFLTHHQNSISFGFAALQFTHPDKIYYSWKLDGFDLDWSEPSRNREAVYTNLKPGKYTFLVRSTNKDGKWSSQVKNIEVNISPPFWKTGWAYIFYLVVFTVILLLILHYNRVRINEKHATEKTNFFINIAHDLRTPLTLIKAPLEQLNLTGKLSEKEAASLILARKNIGRLNRLVTQLMDYQKVDSGKMQLNPAPVEFVSFVKETTESFTPLLKDKMLKFNFVPEKENFEIWIDKDKMEKVIFNLLSNAIKYTPKKGIIDLAVKTTSNYCLLSISDNGIGIPIEQQKKIFTRYFRAKNVINSQETGSGIGLMLVRALVELHSGEISFESKENKGTTFNIKIPFIKYTDLPVNQETETFQTPDTFNRSDIKLQQTPDDINTRYKILVVEDNKELLNFMINYLSQHYKVYGAENGKEGLKFAAEKYPDLIISDIMMPLMDGNQMCQRLKSDITTCHIPVILLTALNTLEYRIEGLNVGADAYIEKPFDINYLMAQVNNLLNSRHMLKEKYAIHAAIPESELAHNNLDAEFLAECKSFVLANLDNPDLTVEGLAKNLSISRPVLYRKIKALTDQSAQDFMRLIRLQEAKKLLKNGNLNIAEVAYQTGFADPKYFSTSFKKFFGKTPSQYTKEK